MGDILVSYYARDIGLARDRKFYKLRIKYGYWAVAVYESLLDRIYSDKGYYVEYSEESKDGVLFEMITDFAGKYQPSGEVVDEIISGLVGCGLFSECHFKLGYLTSRRIQEFFYKFTADRKRVDVDPKIWMLSLYDMGKISKRSSIYKMLAENTDLSTSNADQSNINKNQSNIEKNQSNIEKNQSFYTAKESKGNESKVNERRGEDDFTHAYACEDVVSSMSSESELCKSNAFRYYVKNITPKPKQAEIDIMKYWLYDVNIQEDMFIEAVKWAAIAKKCDMAYINGILKNKYADGIRTGKDFIESEKKRLNGMNKNANSFVGYADQRAFVPSEGNERQRQLMEELLGGGT